MIEDDPDSDSDQSGQHDSSSSVQFTTDDDSQPHPDTIILPVHTRPFEELLRGEPRRGKRARTKTHTFIEDSWTDLDELALERERAAQVNRLSHLDATMATDNSEQDQEERIAAAYSMYIIHDPDILSRPAADDENIETRDAIRAPDAEQFKIAIRAEVLDNLIHGTNTLTPVTQSQIQAMGQYIQIGSTVKCKRKKKGNGEPDKHKARGALRGDQLVSKMLKAGLPLPPTFSPTVKPLTFAFMLQLAITLQLIWCTADIKSAYLNVPRPSLETPILTKLEKFVAEICGLDPAQLYRVDKCLYGLPDSGRHFYKHYRDVLIAEGYTMSKMDNCLFYKITDTEKTFIVLYVDDTLIFSNKQCHIDDFSVRINRHYELTLDPKADSFLGITLVHNDDGTVTLQQHKLLQKLFREHPVKETARKSKKPSHPYGPAPPHTKPQTPDSPAVDPTQYLSLLGLLMYLTKSRPDIMTAVSFGATKSSAPTADDYQQLEYVINYLRCTPDKGHRIFINIGEAIQLYCEVDASYLVHTDSKGHTGYTIGLHPKGPFYNRSAKQTLVSTSSTHAEMRALYTLVKDILFIIYLCSELDIALILPAIIMEDNSAVVTISNEETAYLKKCKHFIMVVNYVREQLELGLISILKIKGTLNNADLLTKKLRDSSFAVKANNILGNPESNSDAGSIMEIEKGSAPGEETDYDST
jgi:hypothetical protein